MLNRIFVGVVVAMAVAWVVLSFVERHQRAENERFYHDKIAPRMNTMTGATLPKGAVMQEWMDRIKAGAELGVARRRLMFAGFGVGAVWIAAAALARQRR